MVKVHTFESQGHEFESLHKHGRTDRILQSSPIYSLCIKELCAIGSGVVDQMSVVGNIA